MIAIDNFYLIYYTLYSLAALTAILFSLKIVVKGYSYQSIQLSKIFSILFVIPFFLLVGFRAYDVGTDTGNYYKKWLTISDFTLSGEFIYYFIMLIVKKIGLTYQHFLLLNSAVFYIVIYKSFKILSERFRLNSYLILFCFLSFFFSLTLSINVVRQGLSLAFLLLAYSCLISNFSKSKILLFSIIALFLHLTSIIPIILFLIATLTKRINLKLYVGFYIIGVVLAYLDKGILDYAPFLSEILQGDKRLSYLTNENSHYSVGFKPQFVIFNTFFLVIFIYIYKKFRFGRIYKIGIIYYIISSVVFFMAFQLSFSDRWGLFSWMFLPVLIAPITNMQKVNNKFYLLFILFSIGIFIFFNSYA